MASGWDSWLVFDKSLSWILDLVSIALLMHCPNSLRSEEEPVERTDRAGFAA